MSQEEGEDGRSAHRTASQAISKRARCAFGSDSLSNLMKSNFGGGLSRWGRGWGGEKKAWLCLECALATRIVSALHSLQRWQRSERTVGECQRRGWVEDRAWSTELRRQGQGAAAASVPSKTPRVYEMREPKQFPRFPRLLEEPRVSEGDRKVQEASKCSSPALAKGREDGLSEMNARPAGSLTTTMQRRPCDGRASKSMGNSSPFIDRQQFSRKRRFFFRGWKSFSAFPSS